MPPIRRLRRRGASSFSLRSTFYYMLLILQLLAFVPSHHHPSTNSYHYYEVYAQETEEDERILQNNNNNNNNNNVCTQPSTSTSSSTKVINQVLSYLDEHRPSIEATILQSYTNHYENATRPSTQYLYDDFRSSLEWMASVGADRGPANGGNSNNGDDGNEWTFYLGPDNCDDDGWHVGLANVATFLSQSMTMVILNDTW